MLFAYKYNRSAVSAEEEAFMRAQLQKVGGALIPENWTPTVPAHPSTGRSTGPSPQYTAQLCLLDIGLAPAAVPAVLGAAAADPNAIALDDEDDQKAAGGSALDKVVRANPDEINLDDV